MQLLLMSYVLCVRFQPKKVHSFDFDSDDEESDDEEDDVTNNEEYTTDVEDDGLVDESVLQKRIEEKKKKRAKLFEHFDSSSFPWLIMKLALVEITMKNINDFVSLAGLELSGMLYALPPNTSNEVHLCLCFLPIFLSFQY